MKEKQTPPPTVEEQRRSLARERRKAMLLAVDLLRHTAHRLIQCTDGVPETFRMPEFETLSEEVAVGTSLLALANRLEPDRQLTRQRHE